MKLHSILGLGHSKVIEVVFLSVLFLCQKIRNCASSVVTLYYLSNYSKIHVRLCRKKFRLKTSFRRGVAWRGVAWRGATENSGKFLRFSFIWGMLLRNLIVIVMI